MRHEACLKHNNMRNKDEKKRTEQDHEMELFLQKLLKGT